MLTHIDEQNNPTMVNVGEKVVTHRSATARSIVHLPDAILALMQGDRLHSKKGPVFDTAIIAATMAVKKCSDLIPFCHPLPIEGCKVQIKLNSERQVVIDCTVDTHCRTGVEMEALMGASVAALTIYDMCKAMSHDIKIIQTELLEKSGGKSYYVKG